MAGHSKWSKIKHKKAANDAKKGKVFSKLAQQISVCVRDGGEDPEVNFSLRLLIDKAKAASMPQDNVQRAIDRGCGKDGSMDSLEEVLYEAFGPDSTPAIISVITDNKNRTVAELRKSLEDSGGNLADSGSVTWNFDQRALISLRPAHKEPAKKYGQDDLIVDDDIEEVMINLMEIPGVMDMQEGLNDGETSEDSYQVLYLFGEVKDLASIRDQVKELGYLLLDAEIIWVPKNAKQVEELPEKVAAFIENIEDLDDVQNIWTDYQLNT